MNIYPIEGFPCPDLNSTPLSLSQPNLKCTQFGKYKKEYEEKIAIAEANIDEAVRQCSAVVEVHAKLSAEKNELVMALQSGGSAVQVISSCFD